MKSLAAYVVEALEMRLSEAKKQVSAVQEALDRAKNPSLGPAELEVSVVSNWEGESSVILRGHHLLRPFMREAEAEFLRKNGRSDVQGNRFAYLVYVTPHGEVRLGIPSEFHRPLIPRPKEDND